MTRILLFFCCPSVSRTPRPRKIVLFGAGSLREAMTAIAADYTNATGVAVRTQFGPSGLMREKIEAGARP